MATTITIGDHGGELIPFGRGTSGDSLSRHGDSPGPVDLWSPTSLNHGAIELGSHQDCALAEWMMDFTVQTRDRCERGGRLLVAAIIGILSQFFMVSHFSLHHFD